MVAVKLHETIADLAYLAGVKQFYSGDSRADISMLISWAKEFEVTHKHTDWNVIDYMLEIESYVERRINISLM